MLAAGLTPCCCSGFQWCPAAAWAPPPLPSPLPNQGAAPAPRRVCGYPGFILARGSLATKAWLCPQAPGCLAGDVSDESGLQPHKGYSCCEKGWWRACSGCTVCYPWSFAKVHFVLQCLECLQFEQARGRVFCSLGDREAARVASLPGWPLAVHQP